MAWVVKKENISRVNMGTGDTNDIQNYDIIEYPIGEYEIDIVVDSDNKFIGILEIRKKRDFLTHQQRIATRSFIDVDEYYKE